jgi:hypothetical protein
MRQEELRENRAKMALEALKPWVEVGSASDMEAPAPSCYRYRSDHLEYSDYKRTTKQGLPTGSGEIERAPSRRPKTAEYRRSMGSSLERRGANFAIMSVG